MGERFQAPAQTTLSNPPVSFCTSGLRQFGSRWWLNGFSVSVFVFLFFTSPPNPSGLPSVAPPTVRPLPRPDVTPPPHSDVSLLYAQGQKIAAVPLNGTRLNTAQAKTLLTLHVGDLCVCQCMSVHISLCPSVEVCIFQCAFNHSFISFHLSP